MNKVLCIGLLVLALLVTAGCVPMTTMPQIAASGETRGGAEPTDPVSPLPTVAPTATEPVSPLPTPAATPTEPVSPLPTVAPTATEPVSPLAAPSTDQAAQPVAVAVSAPVAPASLVYVIHRGDTLARIAGHFGVSMRSILRANPQVRNADRIIVGQRLTIPSPTKNF